MKHALVLILQNRLTQIDIIGSIRDDFVKPVVQQRDMVLILFCHGGFKLIHILLQEDQLIIGDVSRCEPGGLRLEQQAGNPHNL